MLRPTLVSFVALSLLSVARADFSIVQTDRISVGESVSPAQAMMIYQKGKKTRYDIAGRLTVILDTEAKTRTTLDRVKKTYSVDPYEPFEAHNPPGPITVTPTERKTIIAGHKARLFLWKQTMGDIQTDGELWAAEDIERVYFPSIIGGGFAPASQNKTTMKGHPLRIRLMTRVKGGTTAVLTSEVTSISLKELPESYFKLPTDYVKEKIKYPHDPVVR